jgi:hypothetical protein
MTSTDTAGGNPSAKPGIGAKPATLGKGAAPKVVLLHEPRRVAERAEPASRDAQRFAAAILEVLAGVRTPSEAAAALGISVARYYLWEQRALAGLVAGCEPRVATHGPSPRWRIVMLEKEVARLKQDCARQQALVRAAQRTIGLAPPPAPKTAAKPVGKAADRAGGKKPRKRRPVVRALKAAAALQITPLAEQPAAASGSGVQPSDVVQRSVIIAPTPPPLPAHAAAAVGG